MKDVIETVWQMTQGEEQVKIRNRKVRVNKYPDSITLVDITDGCKVGKMAVKAYINLDNAYDWSAFETAIEWFSVILDMFLSGKWPADQKELTQTLQGIRCDAYQTKANYLLNVANLKPLPSVPSKWTIRHVARALANQQYVPGSFCCDGRYTDDYAHDAYTNYGKGPTSHQKLLTDLVESSSGYGVWTEAASDRQLKIHVHCHSFLYYSFILAIEPAS